MPKFKDGDKIRMREDCYGGNAKNGEICTITVNSESGETWAKTKNKSFCNCKHFWELIEETKPEKTWDNLEVGDSVWNGNGDERKVLGVCGKIIFLSQFDENQFGAIDTGEYFKKDGFTLTPPQETITKEEAEKLLNKKIK